MAWHDQPKYRDHGKVDRYIASQPDWQRGILEEIRNWLKQDPDVVEGIAWGVPCYFRNGPLAYTSSAKAHVTLGFFRGIEIEGLESTGNSPIGKFVIRKGRGLPNQFMPWVAAAIELDEAGE